MSEQPIARPRPVAHRMLDDIQDLKDRVKKLESRKR